MDKYDVKGMSCAACSSRVEKAVSKVEGVKECQVNLLTNSMVVEGSATKQDIIDAVEKAGYSASLQGENTKEDKIEDKETPLIRKRLFSSLLILIVLMYISMFHTMWGFPLPSFFAENPINIGLIQALLSGLILVINQKFFVVGFKGLINKSPNMDTLVALGSGASYVYSIVCLFLMSDAYLKGDSALGHSYLHEFYFESAAMILVLITVGKMLEAYSKGKTTNALKSLMDLSPKTAVILVDNKEKTVPVNKVKKGDIFIVRPGDRIGIDGVVLEGESAVDESALTGESIPNDKIKGSNVSAGTINQSGYLKCEAVSTSEDSTLSQIIKMVSDASSSKAPIAKIADRVSGVFVPFVIGIALVTIIVWLLLGESIGFALGRGICVLVISCPCALGLATPVAIMVGNGVGAKNGILFKTATSMEQVGKAKVVVLDKTGTITKGMPSVTDIVPYGIKEEDFLTIVYSLEMKSEHPLSKAIIKKGDEMKITPLEVIDFKAVSGNGLMGKIQGEEVFGGNLNYIKTKTEIKDDIIKIAEDFADEGKTPLFFSKNNKLIGIIAVSDVIKEDSISAIESLKKMGLYVVMLTGDNNKTANKIGKTVGVDKVISDVLPQDKEKAIISLKEKGNVIMVGDGINDAIALTRADVGIAIGAGTDVAIDSADVVLVRSKLTDVVTSIRLSKKTIKNIKENLFWAFIYNVIGIPLAAGVFINNLGWELNPMFGAFAMSLSSFCVVTNALRLNFFKAGDKMEDNNKEIENSKNKEITITMNIEGMMCGHCEMTVKKALEKIDGVVNVVANHTENKAVITMNKEVDFNILKKAVENEDYTVL